MSSPIENFDGRFDSKLVLISFGSAADNAAENLGSAAKNLINFCTGETKKGGLTRVRHMIKFL